MKITLSCQASIFLPRSKARGGEMLESLVRIAGLSVQAPRENKSGEAGHWQNCTLHFPDMKAKCNKVKLRCCRIAPIAVQHDRYEVPLVLLA